MSNVVEWNKSENLTLISQAANRNIKKRIKVIYQEEKRRKGQIGSSDLKVFFSMDHITRRILKEGIEFARSRISGAYEEIIEIEQRILRHTKYLNNMNKLDELRIEFNKLYNPEEGLYSGNLCDMNEFIKARDLERCAKCVVTIDIKKKEKIASSEIIDETMMILRDKKRLENIPFNGELVKKFGCGGECLAGWDLLSENAKLQINFINEVIELQSMEDEYI